MAVPPKLAVQRTRPAAAHSGIIEAIFGGPCPLSLGVRRTEYHPHPHVTQRTASRLQASRSRRMHARAHRGRASRPQRLSALSSASPSLQGGRPASTTATLSSSFTHSSRRVANPTSGGTAGTPSLAIPVVSARPLLRVLGISALPRTAPSRSAIRSFLPLAATAMPLNSSTPSFFTHSNSPQFIRSSRTPLIPMLRPREFFSVLASRGSAQARSRSPFEYRTKRIPYA